MWNLPLYLALWNDSQLATSSKVLYEKLQNSVLPKVVNKRFPGFRDLIWFLKCSLKASFWIWGSTHLPRPHCFSSRNTFHIYKFYLLGDNLLLPGKNDIQMVASSELHAFNTDKFPGELKCRWTAYLRIFSPTSGNP